MSSDEISVLSMKSSSTLSSSSRPRTPENTTNTLNTYTVSMRRCTDKFRNFHNNDYDEEPRRKRPENDKPNNILLFTVINPSYPITTDVLHTICKANGNVVRIVVFKKNGVQAMIEFETLEDANRAKESLNGADIYSGCCTLKIEYAKPTKLNVYKNDSESWDYSNPTLGMGGPSRSTRPGPLLPEPPRLLPTPSGPPSMQSNYSESPSPPLLSYHSFALRSSPLSFCSPVYPNDDYFGSQPNFEFERSYNNPVLDKFINKPRGGNGAPLSGGPGGYRRAPLMNSNSSMAAESGSSGGGAVLMVYELDPPRVNPDKIFNLFCLYGNVAKIKFLKTKEGCCMVQMGDALSAERAMANLSKTLLCNGKRLAVAHSKQAFLSDVFHPYELPDGSESFRDYSGNRKNRFMNLKMAMKNRIQPPSQLLHFFNAPPDVTEEQLMEVLTKADVPPPKEIKVFTSKNAGDDDKPASSASGLIEFEDVKDAVDAIMQANHVPISSESGKYPFMLKLCFSSSRSANSSSRRNRDNFDEELE